MAQEFYIDENGNKIPISGTVTSADMLPLDAGSSKMTSEAIGDLSSLTTTNQDSLVDAVNEVDGKITTATTKTSGTISAGSGCVVRLGSLTKINGVVLGSFSINMTTPISSRTTIGSIPVGFRPYANVSYLAPSSSAINYFQDRITNVIITTSGDIIAGDIFYPSGQTIKEITLAFSYNQGN